MFNKIKIIDKIFAIGIFLDWLTYENILILEADKIFGTMVMAIFYAYKLFFPFLLLLYAGIPNVRFLKKADISVYIICFFLFIIWGLVPTIISGVFISWLKLIPVFILFIGVLSLFIKKPETFLFFSKCIIIYVVFALFQYLIVYIFNFTDNTNELGLAGPYGIFGNLRGTRFLPGFEIPFVRLTGFWKEPSNASGSSFAAYFFSKFLISKNEKKIWKSLGMLCLIAGFLTLSNAGYLSIGLAFFIKLFLVKNKTSNYQYFTLFFASFFVCLLIWFSLFSRSYFSNKGTEFEIIYAISGANQNADNNYDPSSGRIDLFQDAIKNTSRNIIGAGIQPTDEKGLAAPASAPMFWFVLTGFPGLFFLLMMQISLFAKIKYKLNQNLNMLYILQALLVIMTQQLVYGSWMDPNYLIISAAVLSGLKFYNKNKLNTF